MAKVRSAGSRHAAETRDLTLTIPAFNAKTDLIDPAWTLKFMHLSG